MQHARASFVRSGAPGFTKGQQTLIEQISATLCALEINVGVGHQRKSDSTNVSFKKVPRNARYNQQMRPQPAQGYPLWLFTDGTGCDTGR
jgi:hypothetical protein